MGLLITFEGPDGGGKTTQSRLLADYLERAGHDVVLTREPGGTVVGERIRIILHDSELSEIDPVAEALLFSAARAQLVAERIRPALAAGQTVICDRFTDSTIAYQGYGHGLDLGMLRALVEIATGGLRPHLTIILDVGPAAGLERKLAGLRAGGDVEWNRIDAKAVEFHERVRAGYLKIAHDDPRRCVLLDATEPAEALHRKVVERVLPLM